MLRSALKVARVLLPVILISAVLAARPYKALAQVTDELPPVKPPAAAPSRAAPKTGAEAPAGGEAALRRRVEQLEEQIVDMQVVIGTLESLARTGAAAPRAGTEGALPPADSARLDGLETQIRALTAQLEQLAGQVNSQGAPQRRTDAVPETAPSSQRDAVASPLAPPPAATEKPFGSTTITPAERDDPIGGLIAGGPPNSAAPAPDANSSPAGVAPAPLDAPSASPKQLYETAYGYLLQQNYKAAETAFDEFLKRYPNDSLSGNAQYWLGESHFVRGEYKAAAGAFLKGYETYATSTKAPDSLLKLAMSLERLGQKDAACSSYSELTTKFPNAAPHVKSRAQTERQRVGCP